MGSAGRAVELGAAPVPTFLTAPWTPRIMPSLALTIACTLYPAFANGTRPTLSSFFRATDIRTASRRMSNEVSMPTVPWPVTW